MSSLRYSAIGVTIKSDLPEKDASVERILSILCEHNAKIFLDPKRTQDMQCAKEHSTLPADYHGIDLLLVIGGDGTILRSIRELPDLSIPILSVNRGAVGFLAETNIEEVEELLPKLLKGEGAEEKRSLLEVKVYRKDAILYDDRVLNEAVIAQGAIARLLDLRTSINGESLTTFHADGLILSTPTGSTAYSLAAGGPVVHPKINAIVLTPLNPHSFSQKPLVIPDEQSIDVEILKKKNKFHDTEISLTLDGQAYHTLENFNRVTIRISTDTVTFIRRKQDTFYGTLRAKLKWGERLED